MRRTNHLFSQTDFGFWLTNIELGSLAMMALNILGSVLATIASNVVVTYHLQGSHSLHWKTVTPGDTCSFRSRPHRLFRTEFYNCSHRSGFLGMTWSDIYRREM